MKYSQAILFVVGSGVLGGVLAVPSAGQPHPVPALGNGATQLSNPAEGSNSTNTLATTVGHPDGLMKQTQLATNLDGATSRPVRKTRTKRLRLRKKKSHRKNRLSEWDNFIPLHGKLISSPRLASQRVHHPLSESAVVQAPQNTTESSIPQPLSQSTAEKPNGLHSKTHLNHQLPCEKPFHF